MHRYPYLFAVARAMTVLLYYVRNQELCRISKTSCRVTSSVYVHCLAHCLDLVLQGASCQWEATSKRDGVYMYIALHWTFIPN